MRSKTLAQKLDERVIILCVLEENRIEKKLDCIWKKILIRKGEEKMNALSILIGIVSVIYTLVIVPIVYLTMKSAFRDDPMLATLTVIVVTIILVPYAINRYNEQSGY